MRRYGFIFLLAVILTPAPVAADGGHNAFAHAQKARKSTRSVAEQPYGRAGDARKVKRVIRIDMSDTMRFFPSELRVKRGETIRFELRNSGELHHEMVIGSMDDLKQNAAFMRQNAGMNHVDANAVQAAPGQKGRLVWQFTKPGEFYYGCLVPGHFEAGMIGTIVVR